MQVAFDTVIIALLLSLILVAINVRGRVMKALARVERLLDLTEKHGEITDRQKRRVDRGLGEASVKAAEVAAVAAKTTEEKGEDIKGFVEAKVSELRTEFGKRFEHMECLIKELKGLEHAR